MSERTSFYRKIGYAVAIMALLFPLAWLSSPATSRAPGGQLAQMRTEYRLGQANLGEIDPASETMKLATLGLRGVAVNLLWEKANYYKKVEDWDNLSATLGQLANLQPNFTTFWRFQAWNLSYNVSVEFDDYHDRYAKVIEGIKFLMRGERYNVGNGQLLKDLGWFIGQKIGRADEHVQYRRMFKADDDFHPADRPLDQRDNWLVSKEWYEQGVAAVERNPAQLGKISPRIYFSSPAMSQMNYAEAIEEDGFFDKAKRAWIKAGEDWKAFSERLIEHSTGVMFRLGDKAKWEKEVADLRGKLDAMMPDARTTIAAEKKAALTTDERKLLEMPHEQIPPEQSDKLYTVQAKVEVSDRDVADRVAKEHPDQSKDAFRVANELQHAEMLANYTINYRRDANFDYWENRAKFEQTPNALELRELMFRGHKAFVDGNLPEAKKLYQQGFVKWRAVIDAYPSILDDDQTTGEDLVDFIKKYRAVLDQLDEPLPDDFPLYDVLDKFDRDHEFADELAKYHQNRGDAAAPSGAAPAGGSTTPTQPSTPASATK